MHDGLLDIVGYINHLLLTGVLYPSLLLHGQSINISA
jgi:hypothetical protein